MAMVVRARLAEARHDAKDRGEAEGKEKQRMI
jgi:hypothetical protein